MRDSENLGGGSHRYKERRVSRNSNHSNRGKGNSSPKAAFFIGLIFVLFASLFGFINYNEANKRKDYIVTVGYVIDYYDKWDSSNDEYTWKEVIEYTVDGKVYEITSSSYTTNPKPYGSMVNVYYNPMNPGVAVINHKSNTVIIYAVCGILGGAGLIAAFIGVKGFITGKE